MADYIRRANDHCGITELAHSLSAIGSLCDTERVERVARVDPSFIVFSGEGEDSDLTFVRLNEASVAS